MGKLTRIFTFVLLVVVVIGIAFFYKNFQNKQSLPQALKVENKTENLDPLTIRAMRERTYPGSDIVIEQTLSPGSNYDQYIASYKSDGLKIYALLTVPQGNPPAGGWPVIIFNHGYIDPQVYRTTERYIAYVDAFARNGYVVFKSDYRGNGNSEGTPGSAYFSPNYAADILNAISSIKRYKGVNPNKIGMWGHSLGGNITLRNLVVLKDIKAAVMWGGVVGSYEDIIYNWQRKVSYQPAPRDLFLRNSRRTELIQKYGSPKDNSSFWNSVDPTYFVSDISAPVQIHHGLADEEVPVGFSESLKNRLEKAGKIVAYYTYSGADHNISEPSFDLAMQRSVDFFNKYLK